MPKWTPEQLRAITESDANIIVSAGAGSGKTAVLTERVIHKLQQGVKINELLILTFTNDAAGEMKDRIRQKIAQYDDLKDNLDYLDSSYITTFDSYTLSLVKKYHYLINVSPNLSIVDAGIIGLLKEETLDKVFDELYLSGDEEFLKLINDFCIKNDKNLKKSILKIITSLELKSNKEEYLDSYLNAYYSDTTIDQYIKEYIDLIKEECSDIENALYLLSESDYTEYYEDMCKALEPLLQSRNYIDYQKTSLVSMPKRPRGSDDVKEIKDQIANALKNIKELTRFESEDEIKETFEITKDYLKAIIKIIKKFNLLIQDYKDKNDLYEFTDIELMAIDILKKYPEICDELKNFYHEIMVDEYQDTNDLQEEFINLIANDNVYMVGDIKQSIYGFRNANPIIFKNKYDKYSSNDGGIKIDLLKNFRSRTEVLDGINLIFNLIMNNTFGGADYKLSHQMVFGNLSYEENQNLKQNQSLEILNYSKDDDQYTKEETEAFIIGSDIKKKIEDGYEVLDKVSGQMRKATYNDFCIIMDRGNAFETYRKILEFLQIPVVIYEDKKLTSEIDILLINNLINLILKIKDKMLDIDFKYAFVSVARSFLFEYSDEEILTILKDKNYQKTDIYSICENLALKVDECNAFELLNEVIERVNFYEKIIKIGNVEDSLVRIDNLLESARNLSKIGYTIYDFQEYLANMADSEYEITYKVITTSAPGVKIMNIHKSKGLEFPVCYFSGYHKTFNISDIKERFVYDNKYGIITPFFKEGIGCTILKDLLKNKYNLENISERIRLFYVALTRAKEKMIIVTSLEDKPPVSPNKYNSFLSIINSIKANLTNYIVNVDLNKLAMTKDYLFSQKRKDVDNQSMQIIKYNQINITNENIGQKHASKSIEQIISLDTKELLNYGTMMHEIFEQADFINPDLNSPYYGVIKNFITLLNITNQTKIYKEHEFIYEKDNNVYHGIIDLVLIDDNEIKIIDYKLKNIEDEKYKEQLRVYYDYLKSIYDLNVKTYLYSIINNELKEIKISSD